MTTLLFLSSDLMFSSRVMSAAKGRGVSAALVPNQPSLAGKLSVDCKLAIIDLSLDRLDLPAAIGVIKANSPTARIVAYGAHVNEAALASAALASAAVAGCDLVLSNRQFNEQYADLIQALV